MTAIASILLLVAAVGFIVGLKMLRDPSTARRGNRLSGAAMAAAVLGTLLQILDGADASLGDVAPVIIGVLIGAVIGVPAARLVKMTAMPEMVALFNGFGGIASLLIGWGQIELARAIRMEGSSIGDRLEALTKGQAPLVASTTIIAILIGGVTFTGSLVAFGKLAGKVSSKPLLYPGQNLVNGTAVLIAALSVLWFAAAPDQIWLVYVAVGLSFALGVAVVIPIGGGDMPVVISLLNSYSGLAACAAGFAINSPLLIIIGALVGASGIILTRMMCLAMNRSLSNVLFSGFGSGGGGTSTGTAVEKRDARVMTPQDAYFVLEAAQNVVIAPGYGMAVAQAQHAVKELADLLIANGAEVRFAIHPVAGRMPGHMNVLLAEANVSYDQLADPDDVNPTMDAVDVVIVIGANDVVNPAAITDESSPIYGMPIIEAHRAKTVFTLKRSLASGYAGIDNPLFYAENNAMILGDAKSTVQALIDEFKSA